MLWVKPSTLDISSRAVCDYIAGMTDPFAVERFKELFIPKGWTVL